MIHSQHRIGHRRRRAFTLLETILSIALAVVIMFLVGIAINLHLGMLDTRRGDVEEAQLARALLGLMADDLRGVVYHQPEDFSNIAAGGTSSAEGEGSTSGEDTNSGQEGGFEESANDTDDTAALTNPPPKAGLFGNRYQIQIDVSRIPRPDEYLMLADTDGDTSFVDLVSDVKTIAYYVQADDGRQSEAADDSNGGLYRRVLDRMATSWVHTTGNVESLDDLAEQIAPEVTALEFLYFDGIEWLEEWDSDYYGGLPLAVEIAMEISASEANSTDSTVSVSSGSTIQTLQGDRVYRLIVHLPTAQFTGLDNSVSETGGESL